MTGQFPSYPEIEAALRDAFPHFQSDEPITAEAIRSIGREFTDMVMGWEPQKNEIEFIDHNGKTHTIINDAGDYEVGINPGWVLADDSDLISAPAQGSHPCGEAISHIDVRLADLHEANGVFQSTTRDRSIEIQRNDREIRWLNDLRSILRLSPAVTSTDGKGAP